MQVSAVLLNFCIDLTFFTPPPPPVEREATSEPDSDQLRKSRERVALWLKRQHANPSTSSAVSGYETSSEQEEDNEHEKETL